MDRLNIIMPGDERAQYAEYTTEDGAAGGFWLDINSSAGVVRLFLSAAFIKAEILPRIDIVPLPRSK